MSRAFVWSSFVDNADYINILCKWCNTDLICVLSETFNDCWLFSDQVMIVVDWERRTSIKTPSFFTLVIIAYDIV